MDVQLLADQKRLTYTADTGYSLIDLQVTIHDGDRLQDLPS